MTKLFWSLAAMMLTFPIGLAETSWGRGFGGFHGGGGMHMGGLPGGVRTGGGGGMPGGLGTRGQGVGGMPGGNIGRARPEGNFGGGSFGRGNVGGGNFGGGRGARPGGFGAVNDAPHFGGLGAGPGNTNLGNRGFPGGAAGGFQGNQTRPSGLREPQVEQPIARPDRGQLGDFLGIPSDGGLHGVSGGKLGNAAHGLLRYSNSELQQRGDYVRRDFRGRDYYSRAWYRKYPDAWYARRWAYGDAWAYCNWAMLAEYLAYAEQSMYYDYGNNITYQDNSVYVNGKDVGTSDQYYQQARDLAVAGTETQPTEDTQWMPLGVFAMTHNDQNKANLILQLAVNKEGVIRGNYTATVSDHTLAVHGSVDKKTQRAAWTVGDNALNVIETGIYNLTKDEAPALVHFGKDKTEQWLLVRVKQHDQASDAGN